MSVVPLHINQIFLFALNVPKDGIGSSYQIFFFTLNVLKDAIGSSYKILFFALNDPKNVLNNSLFSVILTTQGPHVVDIIKKKSSCKRA